MKATGITRRIDDLGRVVIPKEIRRTLRIREGDPLEIFTDQEGGIVLKKYSTMEDMRSFAGKYADALAQTSGCVVAIADRENIIAASGSGRRELLGQSISRQLEEHIDGREAVTASALEEGYCSIIGEKEPFAWEAVAPIICEGDAVGAVVLIGKSSTANFGETESKLAGTAANFLGKQMEQ